MSRRLRAVASVAALCGSSFVFVAPAEAWEAGSADGVLRIVAAPGESNRVDVDVSGGRIVVSDDAGAPTVLGPGCVDPDEEGVASCDPAGIVRIVVEAGDLDDVVGVGEIGVPVEVRGGDGNDALSTASGDDVLDGGAGNDTLDAGAGSDVLRGGAGDDQLSAGTGDDDVDGGDGVDAIDGDLGNDHLVSGAGSDLIDAGAGDDLVDAGDGDDEVSGGDGGDVLVGAAGRDRITGDEGADRIDGGFGDDDLDGGGGSDDVRGGGGNDLLQTTDGDDVLRGEDGDDRLEGGDGANLLEGGSGNDAINGYGGADRIDAGAGDDTIDGGLGPDAVAGGEGRDAVSYEAATQGVRVTLDGIADDGALGEGDDVRSDIERVTGSALDDTLVAGPFPVELNGGAGRDRLTGSPGADVLSGGDGDDTLDGATGPDLLAGGEGTDVVTYATRVVPVAVTVGLGADDGQIGEGDDVRGDVDRVIGSPKADVLSAVAGLSVRFDGGAGNDRITLPAAPAGAEQTSSRAACGTGTDTAVAGTEDTVGTDCDVVTTAGRLTRLSVQGEPSPRARVSINGVRLGVDGVLRVPVYCGSESAVRCATAIHVNRGFKPIGNTSTEIGRGRTTRILVRLKDAAARKLRRSGGAVRLTLVVTDKAGARSSGSAIVAVKAPAPTPKRPADEASAARAPASGSSAAAGR